MQKLARKIRFQYCRDGNKCLTAALVLLLASCISPNIANWPESVPSQHYFIEAYLADEENQERQSQTEYLGWTLSFYRGNLAYQSGWQDIQSYVLEAPTPELSQQLQGLLSDLGVAIGSEWAKHNDIRLIDTRMLSLWGSTIQLAQDFHMQKQSIEVIAEDVEQILVGGLKKDDVLESRYAEKLGFEMFGDF